MYPIDSMYGDAALKFLPNRIGRKLPVSCLRLKAGCTFFVLCKTFFKSQFGCKLSNWWPFQDIRHKW